MLIAAVLLLCFTVFLWICFFFKFKKTFSPESVLKEIKTEVDNLIIEISRETDRDITLLESRIKSLRTLIEEADKRTVLARQEENKRERERAVLEALQQPKPAAGQADPSMARAAAAYAAETVPRRSDNPIPDTKYSKYSDDVDVPVPDTSASFAGFGAVPEIRFARERIVPKKDIRSQALELAAAGFSSDIIAEKLSITITEAEILTNM